jgi:membrane protein insertase Oxa1/YidC/SpoIIIJ
MMAFIIIMGWSLPVGMGVYWIFGALISIIQSLVTELLHRRNRRKAGNNGDGSDLASIRRSAHHKDGPKKVVKAKTVKKEKPLWR